MKRGVGRHKGYIAFLSIEGRGNPTPRKTQSVAGGGEGIYMGKNKKKRGEFREGFVG